MTAGQRSYPIPEVPDWICARQQTATFKDIQAAGHLHRQQATERKETPKNKPDDTFRLE